MGIQQATFCCAGYEHFHVEQPFHRKQHIMSIDELGISLIPPVSKGLACGKYKIFL